MIVCVGFAFMTCCFELTAWRSDLLCIAFASCFRLVVLGLAIVVLGLLCLVGCVMGFRVGLQCGRVWLFYLVLRRVSRLFWVFSGLVVVWVVFRLVVFVGSCLWICAVWCLVF